MNQFIRFALLSVTLLALAACGGGGSGAAVTGPQRTATVSFAILGNYSSPISGVSITARLPQGVNVALDGTSHTLQQPGLSSTKGLAFGSYSAGIRQVDLGVVNLNQSIGYGTFATLQLTVQPGYTFSAQDFRALNSPFPAFKAVANDPILGVVSTDTTLAGRITPSLDVTFGY
ncbi:hypothetical protein GMST_01180 [Geomonas silvestris]|uniref:Lipoprotein n=1 Tax=Geomonas silvestris TaxID=2740184 RepID=A0A6V8MDB5_9BACT|nr:hypothetical protein [Geomonas silvestris]GFO57793.1 hypothetical protein GMST_01180 [Geomonas silvestris]